MVRLFVAVDIPEEIRDQYAVALDTIRSSRARCSYVDPSLLHITLKFIGEVEGSRLSSICDALKTVSSPKGSLSLGLITLDNQKRPRLVWGEITDPGECQSLAKRIDEVLLPLGIEPEKRRFRPHVTLARVRQSHSSLYESVSSVSSSCSGSFEVDRFTLKKSELTPYGPIYTPLLEVLL